MEPFTTTALISVATYIGTKLADRTFDSVLDKMSSGVKNWYNSTLQGEDVIEDLRKNPKDELNLEDMVTALKKSLRDDPTAEQAIKELLGEISKDQSFNKQTYNLRNSDQNNFGNINAGGDVKFSKNDGK